QFLHLKHRLDIVLVDRQAPFGNEFLLPRGTLRESPRNLRRASYIFITKNTGESNEKLIGRIRRYNRTAEIIECAHRPLYLQNTYTGERLMLDRLRGAFIGSICGIAAPESFEGALKNLGANVDLSLRYIDHHYYTEGELRSFINRCIRRDLAMIITTEKAFRLEPGQGALPESRDHQRSGDRLLHPERAGAVTAPPRSASDDEALSEWRGRSIFLRKELSVASAEMGEDGESLERRQQPDDELLPCPRSADAGF